MSYGVKFIGYCNRARLATVESDIEECNEMIRFYERRLLAMAATGGSHTPEDMMWYDHVASEVPELVESLVEYSCKLALLLQIKKDPKAEEE